MQNLYWISARRIRLNRGWNWGYGVFQTMPDLPELSLMQTDDGKYFQERPDLTKLLGKRNGEPFYHETEYNTLIGRNLSDNQFLVCGMQFLFRSLLSLLQQCFCFVFGDFGGTSFYFEYFLKMFVIYYLWLCWVFVAVCGSCCWERGSSSLCCAGLSLEGLLLLRSTGSRARRLQ